MYSLNLQPDGNDGLDAPIISAPYAAVNYGSSHTLLFLGTVFAFDQTVFHRGVLSFDLASIAPGASILAAGLDLYSDGSGDTPGTSSFLCRRLTRTNWTENGVTWNRYDGVNNWTTAGGDATALHAVTAQATGASLVLSFTGMAAMVAAALGDGLSRLHVLLSGPEVAGVTDYYAGLTSETTTPSERPRLWVQWSPAVPRRAMVATGDAARNLVSVSDRARFEVVSSDIAA